MRLSTIFAALGMLLMVLFVGVIPVIVDMQRMPTGEKARPQHPYTIHAWPVWPPTIASPGNSHAPTDLENMYEQMAAFANRCTYPMYKVERTIGDVKAGRASSNYLYQAARAAEAAAADERDALMGLVLPPSLRSNVHFLEAWKLAQLASLAKLRAVQVLEEGGAGSRPWEKSEYLRSLQDARELTSRAIALARSSIHDGG